MTKDNLATDAIFRLIFDNGRREIIDDATIWEAVKESAGFRGVAPVIAYICRSVPGFQDREWADAVLTRNWRIHSRNLQHLHQIVECLAAAGIEAVSLKGPALACRHYNPAFLRKPAADLDFAVRQGGIPVACDALRRLGYRVAGSLSQQRRTGHHVWLTHESLPKIELHFRLSSLFDISFEPLIDRSVGYSLPSGIETLILAPADELFHLVLHLLNDRFSTAFHLYEVHRIWRASPPDVIEDVLSRAPAHRCLGAFALVNAAVRHRTGKELFPPESLARKPSRMERFGPDLYVAMESNAVPVGRRNLAGRIRGRWLDLQIADTWPDALRSCGRTIIPALRNLVVIRK